MSVLNNRDNLIPRKSLYKLSTSGPMGGTDGGDTTIVVQTYTLGQGVTIDGNCGDLRLADGTFELKNAWSNLTFHPTTATNTKRPALPIEHYEDTTGLQIEAVDQEKVSEGCVVFEHSSLVSKTVIVSLPPATGKTTTAHDLATRLGCKYIVDEWHPAHPVLENALHLTNAPIRQGGAA